MEACGRLQAQNIALGSLYDNDIKSTHNLVGSIPCMIFSIGAWQQAWHTAWKLQTWEKTEHIQEPVSIEDTIFFRPWNNKVRKDDEKDEYLTDYLTLSREN